MEIVLKELKLEPSDLTPTQKVVDLYQELVYEILKMLALETYIKKKKEEHGLVKEVINEKRAFQNT